MEWARALMMNSCGALLAERINKKFKDFDLYKQGGVTYIIIALDELPSSVTLLLQPTRDSLKPFPRMEWARSLTRMSVFSRSR
jgi:hypothetical protein